MDTLSTQLKSVLKTMSELPFITRDDYIKHKVHPTGIKAFEHSVKEISSTMIHYLSEMDKEEVHIYSYPENHYIFLAENLSFFDEGTLGIGGDQPYEVVEDWFTKEYEKARKILIDVLGNPSYQNDDFVEYFIQNRKYLYGYSDRKDIPFELQMVANYSGDNKLTYWNKNERVIYLVTRHEDKETPMLLLLGMEAIS